MDADSAPAQNNPTTKAGRSVLRTMNGRMKSALGGFSGKSTPAKPMRKTGTRKSWKVGKSMAVFRMMSSFRAVNAFMKR